MGLKIKKILDYESPALLDSFHHTPIVQVTMAITPELLNKLQKDPLCIRNICILAHVDHGKTTLSDSLLTTNGIISSRMAGKIRYLDSRPDEQQRGITMESSAISLYFRLAKKSLESDQPVITEHLINLIDSPGHIDFTSEVSIASRLCDGALVLVDVIEGVQSQTVTVLRQCWNDRLKPILVLNKIDRLIGELKMSPSEAYLHLKKLVEQTNAIIGSFFAGERMLADEKYRDYLESNPDHLKEFVESDDEDIYFRPEKNNVIFCSAIDGWGFTVQQLAGFYEKKLGYKKENLQKVLWGDFYLDPKTKKVINYKGLKGRSLKPLFVSLILENIWKIHQCTVDTRDQEVLGKIISTLGIKILPRDLRSKDSKLLFRQVMSQWLPVSSSVLITVVLNIQSPVRSQKIRIPVILDSIPDSDLLDPTLHSAMLDCDMNGPVSCYVSKMVSVPELDLPQHKRAQLSENEMQDLGRLAREKARKAAEQSLALEEQQKVTEDFSAVTISGVNDEFDFGEFEEEEVEIPKEVLIGVARVYSGTLKVGQKVNVLGPKYSPRVPDQQVTEITIQALYLLMGRELIAIEEVPAGNIVGIGGLEGKVLKNGSIIDTSVVGVNLASVSLVVPPFVKVALEPVNPMQMDRLESGLKLLKECDPCAETYINENGEHILLTSGELHLERCLKDLKERFAGVDIQSSEPSIPYRETVVSGSEMNPAKCELGRGRVKIQSSGYEIVVSVKPLPLAVAAALDSELINLVVNLKQTAKLSALEHQLKTAVAGLEDKRSKELFTADLVDKIVAFGPKRIGPCLLVDLSGNFKTVFGNGTNEKLPFIDSILNGFQLATNEGPLAAEPMEAVTVLIESVAVVEQSETYTNVTTLAKDAIHKGFLDWSPRLMLAMYSCDIQASAEVLGKVYAVVQKRKGKIVSEEMKDGTLLFTIKAVIPVVEAFGFSEEFRKKTSGAAIPQLVFSGYEIIDEDPFWVPQTEEELEQLGTFAERENIARKYMNRIRKSKGLFVDEKIVKDGEKQRNLKRD